MAETLILYSTADEHTREICQRIMQVIEQQDHLVSLISIDDESTVDIKRFDKIVIGASIRYEKKRFHSTQKN